MCLRTWQDAAVNRFDSLSGSMWQIEPDLQLRAGSPIFYNNSEVIPH